MGKVEWLVGASADLLEGASVWVWADPWVEETEVDSVALWVASVAKSVGLWAEG